MLSPFHFSLHSGFSGCRTTCSTSPCMHPFRHDGKIAKNLLLASSYPSFGSSVCPSIHPSVRMKQLGSHWTEFHEISWFRIFRKSIQKIQVSLKSDKNTGHLTRRPVYMSDLSRSVLLRMQHISDKSRRKTRNTHFISSNIFFEYLAVYVIMWKNIVERGGGGYSRQYGACVLHAGYLRLQTHTQVVTYALIFHCNNG